jgi:two-component system chemotaxis response regulator CheB
MIEDRKFLLPGEFHVTRINCEIATLLGSCVSVTLWHPEKRYAAMNHFLLAEFPEGGGDQGRYGDSSISLIIRLMGKLNPDIRKFHAGVYGGGAVIGHLGSAANIGERNIEIARKILAEHGIKIVDEDVGDTRGRRIYMDNMTGKVTVRIIEKSQEMEALAQKRRDIAIRDIRVLIVDDSPLVRKILRSAVEKEPGMVVCGEARDAFEARNLILETDPDVISLDIIMPKMNGLAFLKKLSQHYPKPVVICSTIAKAGSDIAQKAREYGAICCVDKEKLNIYRGLEAIRTEYLPRLREAAGHVVRKKLFDSA